MGYEPRRSDQKEPKGDEGAANPRRAEAEQSAGGDPAPEGVDCPAYSDLEQIRNAITNLQVSALPRLLGRAKNFDELMRNVPEDKEGRMEVAKTLAEVAFVQFSVLQAVALLRGEKLPDSVARILPRLRTLVSRVSQNEAPAKEADDSESARMR